MNEHDYSLLLRNLHQYLDVLIENNKCKNGKNSSILVELHKKIFDLKYTKGIDKVDSKEDFLTKKKIDNLLSLLKDTELETKELETLKSSLRKDWNNFREQNNKETKNLITEIEKLSEKAIKKHPELNRSIISVHENNYKGIKGAKNQTDSMYYKSFSLFFRLYSNVIVSIEKSEPKTSFGVPKEVTFSSGLNECISYIRKKLSENDYIYIDDKLHEQTKNKINEQEIIEAYNKYVTEGKINKISEEPLTFFAKMGFQPLKKQISVAETIQKLQEISYVKELLDNAIMTIKCHKGSADFSKTLNELKNLRKKYSVILNETERDLNASDYNKMKAAVEKQKEIELKEQQDKQNRETVKLLYKKILKSEDKEEIKKLLEEIRFIELPVSEKEKEKNNAATEYEIEKENKKIEQKIIKEEYQQEQDYKKEIAMALRNRAIKALEMENAFASDYYESGLDVKDNMTSERKEDLIQRKMQELKNQDVISKKQQALQDLKDLGYLKREDATLSNLLPYEYDALLAQMRINAREEEQKTRGGR